MAGSLRTLLIVASALLLNACASLGDRAVWPEDLPARQEFSQAWQSDSAHQAIQTEADYLLWVRRFYTGFNLVPGWLDMMSQVSERIDESQWSGVQIKLKNLGQSIGAEWAKENEIRSIDTRCVAVWRDALLESLVQDDLEPFLSRLEEDVIALLSGGLSQDEIFFERYYVDEFDF